MQGFGVKFAPDGERYFQHWLDGELVDETPVAENPRCALVLEEEAWMFASADCINGLAHGAGIAVRLDGQAYVDGGRFVLGNMVAGEMRWLISPDEAGR